MSLSWRIAAAGLLGVVCAACASSPPKPLVDPFPLRFPMVEAGRLPIGGPIAGQPRVRDGILYYATRDGWLTAVVVPSRVILWRFQAAHGVARGPDLGEDMIFLRDDGNILYVLGYDGALLEQRTSDGPIATAIGERSGCAVFATAEGSIRGVKVADDARGRPLWEFPSPSPVSAGPVFTADPYVLFGDTSGRLRAFDLAGKLIWTFSGRGAITADPVVFGGRVYFGTADRVFYCLSATKGRKKWARRLQGAPVQPALATGSRVVVAASNSVVYILARGGGSIVGWDPVASRICYEPVAAGPYVLVSSAAPGLKALNARTGLKAEEQATAGGLLAGALPSPPYVVLFVEDEGSGRQEIVFLRSR